MFAPESQVAGVEGVPGRVGQGCPCTGPVSGCSLLSWESLGPSFWRGESAANHCLRPDPHLTKAGAPPRPRPLQVTDTDVSRLLLGRNSQGSTGGRRSEQIDPASLGRRAESPLTLSTARPPGLCALPVRGDMSIDGDCKHGTGPPLSSDAELISGPCSAQRKWCRNKFPHECRPGM